MRMKYLLFVLLLLVTACAPGGSGQSQSGQSSTSNTLTQERVYCSDTGEFVGRQVTCWLGRAYCTYAPESEGTPTFCNDAPYPNHSFTMVAWESDWNDLDGHCLLITGTVSLYEGLPEIEVRSRSQVQLCD
jgi:hypothetical protein